jgi:hypothetical protein
VPLLLGAGDLSVQGGIDAKIAAINAKADISAKTRARPGDKFSSLDPPL